MKSDQMPPQIYFESVYLNEGMLSESIVAVISQSIYVNKTTMLYILKNYAVVHVNYFSDDVGMGENITHPQILTSV